MKDKYKQFRWWLRYESSKSPYSTSAKLRRSLHYWTLNNLIWLCPPSERPQYLDFLESYRQAHLEGWENVKVLMDTKVTKYRQHYEDLQRKAQ